MSFKNWKMSDVEKHNKRVAKKICGQLSSAVNEREGSEMPTESKGMRQPLASRIARRSTEKSGATIPDQKKGTPRKPAYTEEQVRNWCKDFGLPEPVFELKFHPTRKWRFDIAWLLSDELSGLQGFTGVALEVQGQIWFKGGHSSGVGIKRDWEKFMEAQILGWKIAWCEPKDLLTKETAEIVKRLLT